MTHTLKPADTTVLLLTYPLWTPVKAVTVDLTSAEGQYPLHPLLSTPCSFPANKTNFDFNSSIRITVTRQDKTRQDKTNVHPFRY